MVLFNDIEVWVEQLSASGQWSKTNEFQIVHADASATCFIASEVGAHFRLAVANHRAASFNSAGFWCSVHVDGQQASINRLGDSEINYFTGVRTSATEERAFRFAKVRCILSKIDIDAS